MLQLDAQVVGVDRHPLAEGQLRRAQHEVAVVGLGDDPGRLETGGEDLLAVPVVSHDEGLRRQEPVAVGVVRMVVRVHQHARGALADPCHHVGESVTLTQLAEVPWVVTHHGPTAFTPAVRQLRMLGVEPRVEVVVESFLPVPFLVAGTARVALLQRGLAARLGCAAGVRVVECPWEVIPLVEALWWHPSHATDPAHAWMRRLAVEAGRQVGAPPD